MLIIDGSAGEGGGQILRTSLSLAIITATPFRIENIRANRRKPGLQRQHLTCVKAAAEICGARVEGADIGATAVTFTPGPIRGGEYAFAIGSAGSTCLVFQTVLPALLTAAAPSRLTLEGGTHNPMAPSFDFIERAFLPQLARMGADIAVGLDKPGFYPAGGGRWHATITPAGKLRPLTIETAGDIVSRRARADVAHIPYDVALRETRAAVRLLAWPDESAEPRTVTSAGPGNVLMLEVGMQHVTEIVTGFGERGLSAETVAERAVGEMKSYLAAGAPVGPHLADQLLLPMALSGGGSFVSTAPTGHTRTNIAVIEKFMAVEFTVAEIGHGLWRIDVSV